MKVGIVVAPRPPPDPDLGRQFLSGLHVLPTSKLYAHPASELYAQAKSELLCRPRAICSAIRALCSAVESHMLSRRARCSTCFRAICSADIRAHGVCTNLHYQIITNASISHYVLGSHACADIIAAAAIAINATTGNRVASSNLAEKTIGGVYRRKPHEVCFK